MSERTAAKQAAAIRRAYRDLPNDLPDSARMGEARRELGLDDCPPCLEAYPNACSSCARLVRGIQ